MERDEKPMTNQTNSQPQQLLSVPDGIFLMAGMVIGVGIFKAPSIVAANSASALEFFGAWILGALASLCGALVYAELASRHPDTGGEYTYLSRGLGSGAGFLFAWSRLTVIQTGAIAAVAFVFGDYASEAFNLGAKSSAIYAALIVVALTALNVAGTMQTKLLQKVMETLLIAGLVLLAIGGLVVDSVPKEAPPAAAGSLNFGLAMIFVLLTYGGWNEAAYLAGEVKDARRKMIRILVFGILAVTALYLLVNLGYYTALGLGGMKESKAVGADLMRLIAGDRGALLIALIVCISAATTINAAIFTGARTNYAFGRDFALVAKLGSWRQEGSTPANALLVQCAITLLLILAASYTPDGFSAMVAYTSPVFWTFFFLTGATLVVFRMRGGEQPAFKVPAYPLVLLAFLGMCGYMLYSSINYIRFAVSFGNVVLAGVVVMALGVPLYFIARRK
jgi:APA family basic amino acid/polyamine antiporter